MITRYERGSTWRTQVVYTSGSTNVDCSGNVTKLTVYGPDGTTLITDVSGVRTSTGTYHYYVSTQSDYDLGLYVGEWKTYFFYEDPFRWQPKIDREVVNLVKVIQS